MPSKRRSSDSSLLATSEQHIHQLRTAKQELTSRLLRPGAAESLTALSAAPSPAPSRNLVGVGIGEKITDGKATGVMAVKLLVRIKYPENEIPTNELLPRTVDGLPVDVEQVGTFRRFPARGAAAAASTMPNPRTRIRPAPPGSSIGFKDPNDQFVMAGTFGALVKKGKKLFVLSNNHVVADENRLALGSPVFQPGLLDGGKANSDQIAQLTKFVSLKTGAINKVDCAIAEVKSSSLVSNAILFIGSPQGTANAQIDAVVHKFGRTTGYRVGRITSIDTDVNVGYDVGTLTFEGQIIIVGLNDQPFSAPGDSGSLILERTTQRAVGLLFAGSTSHTIANHIGDVLQVLKVRLA
jgi:hypothetical protein